MASSPVLFLQICAGGKTLAQLDAIGLVYLRRNGKMGGYIGCVSLLALPHFPSRLSMLTSYT